ncbi:choice-of-anchor Q domain-containing protein [Polaribacter sp. R77954]|uniref:choice-of-anchor Q domain-containing protein n=1 Tax=Polaribacter sp. R77954 TaxID=3093870 RepID=UPI0037C95920
MKKTTPIGKYTRALGGTLDVNITNSLFLSNTLEAASGNGDNGLLWFRQDPNFPQNITIVNCTFARNTNITRSAGSSIIVANKAGNGSVRVKAFNSIFWENQDASNNPMRALGNDHPSLQNANLYQIESSISEEGLTNLPHNNTSVININNSSEDPLFKNSKDFTLQHNSIAINVGDNSKIPSGITKDLLGNTRLQADKVDLGCFETSSSIRNAPFKITYVDKNATGNNDGSSWSNALTDLQTALTNADPTKEIWVAKGIHKPVLGGGGRFNRFLIDKDFTTIYGGFAGNEKSPLDRDINNNQTIINGDVNDDDTGNDFSRVNRTDNLYQLFVIDTYNVTIDGFTLTSGTADVNSATGVNPRGEGAAITVIPRNFSIPVNLTLRNSIVENNLCIRGGVIRVLDKLGTINVENTVFRNNLATFATVLYTRAYVATNGRLNTNITNCLFDSNTLAKTSGISSGGIMYFRGAQVSKQFVIITNSTFVDNDNASSGNTSATLISAQSGIDVKAYNSIFWNNKNANNQTLLTVGNDISSGVGSFTVSNSLSDDTSFDLSTTSGNINSNPLFTSTTDFTLQSSSPAVNAGDNSKVPTNINLDLAGETRIFGTAVDMGAYESKVVGITKRTLTITATNGTVTTNPNPINGTYDDGTVVTITAIPDNNFGFVEWTGDVTATTITTTVTMDADKSITANFSATASTNDEILLQNTFKVFPNPVQNVLNVATDIEIETIKIYNVLGRKVMVLNQKKINVSNLNAGIYLMQIETRKGKRVTKKFMKK